MKRLCVTLLVLSISGALWAGGGTQQTTKKTEEPVTITAMLRLDPTSFGNFREKGSYKFILDKFNVDLDVESIANAPFQERLQVTMMSGDLPDFIGAPSSTISDYNEWGKAGLLYKINTVLDKMPTVKQILADNAQEARSMYAADGNLYFVTGYTPGGPTMMNEGFFVRKDKLDEVGFDLSKVETFDDHVDMYRALKKANDGKPPVTSRRKLSGWMGMLSRAMYPLGLSDGHPIAHPVGCTYDDANDVFFYPFTHPDAKFGVEWLRTLFTEELLHPDSLTMSSDIWEPAIKQGKNWLAVWDWYAWTYYTETELKGADPNLKMDWVAVKPPKWKGEQKGWRNWPSLSVVLLVNAKTQHIDKIAEMSDYFASKEGGDIIQYGLPNENFVYVGDLPVPLYRTPSLKYEFPAGFKLPKPLGNEDDYKAFDDWWGNPKFFRYIRGEGYAKANELPDKDNKILTDWVPKYEDVYTLPPEPTFPLGDYDEELKGLLNALNTASYEMIAKMMTAQLPMSAWDDLQTRLKQLGVARFVELVNKAYQESK